MTEARAPTGVEPLPPRRPRPPRLLVVTGLDIRAFRGGEKYAIALGRELSRRGVDVRLLSKVDPNGVHRLRDDQVGGVVGLPLEVYHPRLIPLLPPLVPDLFRLVAALRWADTVYTIEATPRLLSMLLALTRWVGRRFVVGLHSPTLVTELAPSQGEGAASHGWTRELEFVWSHADVVHALTRQQASALAARGIARNVVVVPSFPTVALSAERPAPGTAFELLFVGPLEREQKGIDLLIDIGRKVLRGSSDARLSIVGSGPGEPLVRGLVSEFPDRVRGLGFVPESVLPDLYARSHVLLLPSRAEALPLVALEAFSEGVPVVGFTIPGLDEVSAIYPEGRVPSFDTERFASTVLALNRLRTDSPEEYAALRARCRERCAERYGTEVIVPQLARMLGLPLPPSA